jgi:hypothetical protein
MGSDPDAQPAFEFGATRGYIDFSGAGLANVHERAANASCPVMTVERLAGTSFAADPSGRRALTILKRMSDGNTHT